MSNNWTNNLPSEVYDRLCNCQSTKADIRVLVDTKWAAMVEAGKDKQGFVREDALVQVLELLDANGQYIDLSREEYDKLK